MSMIQEFKDFALKGNMIDMAVGIIIGAATSTVVGSLVKDIVMPPIGVLLGGIDFSSMKWSLTDKADGAAINYGVFINHLITFVIVAFVVFLLIKMMNAMRTAEEAAPPPEPPASEVYLKEIRDALTNKS